MNIFQLFSCKKKQKQPFNKRSRKGLFNRNTTIGTLTLDTRAVTVGTVMKALCSWVLCPFLDMSNTTTHPSSTSVVYRLHFYRCTAQMWEAIKNLSVKY